jgi:Concanavalin A-like lectin/glucanases superfamily
MSYADEVRADSPDAWHRFNDVQSPLVADSTSNDRPLFGTFPGEIQPGWTGIASDGGSSCISAWPVVGNPNWIGPPQPNPFSSISTWSIEFWTWPQMSQNGTLLVNNMFLQVMIQFAFPATFSLLSGATVRASASVSGSGLTRWHHWVATGDGTTARLYADGVQVASGASADAPQVPFPVIQYRSGEGALWMAEMATYRHTLSPTRVLAHYNAQEVMGHPTPRPQLARVC